jgi:hypothetical protein
MPENYLTLTRQSPYDLVWSKPMVEVAKQFGISDRGRAERCAAVDVCPFRLEVTGSSRCRAQVATA